jgi:hypothetical protein
MHKNDIVGLLKMPLAIFVCDDSSLLNWLDDKKDKFHPAPFPCIYCDHYFFSYSIRPNEDGTLVFRVLILTTDLTRR